MYTHLHTYRLQHWSCACHTSTAGIVKLSDLGIREALEAHYITQRLSEPSLHNGPGATTTVTTSSIEDNVPLVLCDEAIPQCLLT